MQVGKGIVIASEINFKAGKDDPIARRLLNNIINYLDSFQKRDASALMNPAHQ